MADKEGRRKSDLLDDKIWRDIKEKAEELRYGNITITLQDGKIVQVETSTKTRYS